MANFIPMKKTNYAEEIAKHLLAGDVIRADSRDEMPIEVMVRECVPTLHTMKNIGMEKNGIIKKINCSHTILHDVIENLKKDYSVRKVLCEWSGCCQYTTYAYFLD